MVYSPDAQITHNVFRARMVGAGDPEIETPESEPAGDGGEIKVDRLAHFFKPTGQLVSATQSGSARKPRGTTPR